MVALLMLLNTLATSSCALKGHPMVDQGNALGPGLHIHHRALKGRPDAGARGKEAGKMMIWQNDWKMEVKSSWVKSWKKNHGQDMVLPPSCALKGHLMIAQERAAGPGSRITYLSSSPERAVQPLLGTSVQPRLDRPFRAQIYRVAGVPGPAARSWAFMGRPVGAGISMPR